MYSTDGFYTNQVFVTGDYFLWGFLFIFYFYFIFPPSKEVYAGEDLIEPFSVKICYSQLHSLQIGILVCNFSDKTNYEMIAPVS